MIAAMYKLNRQFTLRTSALLSVLLISACEAVPSDTARLQQEGYDPSYITAYDDGCHSGRASAGNMFEHLTKDVKLYSQSSEYEQGWEDGFRVCEGRELAFQRRVAANMDRLNRSQQVDQVDRAARDAVRDAMRDIDTNELNQLGN